MLRLICHCKPARSPVLSPSKLHCSQRSSHNHRGTKGRASAHPRNLPCATPSVERGAPAGQKREIRRQSIGTCRSWLPATGHMIVAASEKDDHALSDWATPQVLYHVLAPKTGERHGQGARLQPLGTLALQRPTEEHSWEPLHCRGQLRCIPAKEGPVQSPMGHSP